jgi:hypothetical protein
MHVRETIAGVEKQELLDVVSLSLALGIQHAMRMRRIAICVLYRSTIFFTLSHKRHNFRGEKMLLNIRCVFLFSL